MNTNFQACLIFIRKEEGGNDDDPEDHGGRTSRGITQREFNAWCDLHGSPEGDVWNCSDATIDSIYHQSYWNPYCDLLPKGLDLMFFDTAVLEGSGKAILFLQGAVGVAQDGHIGVITMSAVKNIKDLQKVLEQFKVERDRHFKNLHQRRFLRGWLNRSEACYKLAVSMVNAV